MIDTRKILLHKLDLVVAVLGLAWLVIALFTADAPSRARVTAYLAAGVGYCLSLAVWTGFYLYGAAMAVAYLIRNRKEPERQGEASSAVTQPVSFSKINREDKRNLRRRANRYGPRRIGFAVDALMLAALAVFIAKFPLAIPTPDLVFMAGVVLLPSTLAMRILGIARRSLLLYWDLRENGIRET